jgi:hypothetical protein
MSKKDKVGLWVSNTAMAVTFLFIASLTVLAIYPFNVIEFKDEFFPVSTSVVKAGGQVQYTAVSTKYMRVAATVNRHLVDTYVYSYPSITAQTSKGSTERVVTLKIPEFAEPGLYRVKTIYTYRINFLQTKTYIKYTESFEVVR